jgi:ABC-type polysaccharide/polyol phosphate export permease
MTSVLPDLFIQPVVMFVLFFWIGGFGGPAELFPALIINLLQAFACFGLGQFLSVLCKDLRMAITTLFSYLISSYLLGMSQLRFYNTFIFDDII